MKSSEAASMTSPAKSLFSPTSPHSIAPEGRSWAGWFDRARGSWDRLAASISLIAVLLHLESRYGLHSSGAFSVVPLWIAILAGGFPLLYNLLLQVWNREFGADFLAGLSIVTATMMGELLVATIIILMLSGGQALEKYATRRASSVLNALARRTPSIAHRIFDTAASDIP